MLNVLRSVFAKREIYFHEDDYCQQELLPREALNFAETEIKKIAEFAGANRASDGAGWTDVYVRPKPPVNFRTLGMRRDDIDAIIAPHLPPFELVYSGYGSFRERRSRTAAWGTSQQNAIIADWDDGGIIANVWTQFFEADEKALVAAGKAVGAMGRLHSLVYVDWAWGYTCEIVNDESLISPLRSKLADIAERTKNVREST